MPGAGTKPAITKNNPSARLLDVTRLLRRAGRVLTGVDRVELAYLQYLSAEPTPFFALARTRLGYVLLDRDGAQTFAKALLASRWDKLDGLGQLAFQRPVSERRAEATLRRLAIARCLPIRLSRMLRKSLPQDVTYLNTGHSNFTNRVISAIKSLRTARIAVLIHDTIPLDHPETQRPETRTAFEAFLRRVSRSADLVIYNSDVSYKDGTRHMTRFGRAPNGIVAHLGVEAPEPTPLPDGLPPDAPYFVVLGTIEPRKNHALLLDIWDNFAASPEGKPHLVICGNRGWRNEAVFSRLDTPQGFAGLVHEVPGLSDGQIATLLRGACAMLFPSVAEGFGLPPAEAAMAQVPTICSDLEVLQEVLGDIPIYLSPSDTYSWQYNIEQMVEQRPEPRTFEAPTWDNHFKIVLRSV